jgi:hypothetical protein
MAHFDFQTHGPAVDCIEKPSNACLVSADRLLHSAFSSLGMRTLVIADSQISPPSVIFGHKSLAGEAPHYIVAVYYDLHRHHGAPWISGTQCVCFENPLFVTCLPTHFILQSDLRAGKLVCLLASQYSLIFGQETSCPKQRALPCSGVTNVFKELLRFYTLPSA